MKTTNKESANIWLTNFCESIRLFVSIVLIQIAVIVYSLSFFSFNIVYLKMLSFLTIFSQFTGLLILVSLCKLGPLLNRFQVIPGLLIVIMLVITITSVLSELIYWIDIRLLSVFFSQQTLDPYLNLKLSLVSLILTLTIIRYFYVQDQRLTQIEKLSNAKLQSLQSKIKPHFLFNTLNSIVSLISIDSEKAEKAVVDFSELMRRTFIKQKETISLSEELKFVKHYLEIEALRLGNRMKYELEIDSEHVNIQVPVLSIQPLVENSIIHGIQNLPEGGVVRVSSSLNAKILSINVSNPYNSEIDETNNGTALENIRQRLNLLYGNKASLKLNPRNEVFNVTIKIPV